MAVEKMKVMGIIGKNIDFDSVSRAIVINGKMHLLDAVSEISTNYLKLAASEEYLDEMEGLADLKPYSERRDFSQQEEMILNFHDLFDIKPTLDPGYLGLYYDYNSKMEELKQSYDSIKEIKDRIDTNTSRVKKLASYVKNINYLTMAGIELSDLCKLELLKAKLIVLSVENYHKLKMNRENIPSLTLHLATEDKNVILLSLVPQELEGGVERIYASLNCSVLELPDACAGSEKDMILKIQSEIKERKAENESLKNSLKEFKKDNIEKIKKAYTVLKHEEMAESVKNASAVGKNLFYIYGFVPENEIKGLTKLLEAEFKENLVIIVEGVEQRGKAQSIPTRIKNNWIVKPFEYLVMMYGIPGYREKDPTAFFAITYLLLFGAMFGDIGQGFVIFCAGLAAAKKMKDGNFGSILTRLGLSSMLFGLAYGSIFGNEHLIPALIIRPMEHINQVLIWAVGIGIILLTTSYFYGFINRFKARDIEEGLLGKDGLAGFLLFIVIIFTAASLFTEKPIISAGISVGLIMVLLILMVVKQPLVNKIAGKDRLYEDRASDYFIEAGFGIIETLLSVMSNTISFIRVGAFALNHAGLYLAFATMADMINSGFGGILVLIIGNIVIIGLEGLIVFIQGLRLEYYELFSKYYSGDGILYKPIGFSEPS